MQISAEQLCGIVQCSNGFIGVVVAVLGDKYRDPAYSLTQEDVTLIETSYEREFGNPAAIGSDTIFGAVTPEMYSEASSAFCNQVVAANRFFSVLGFEFAKRDSTT